MSTYITSNIFLFAFFFLLIVLLHPLSFTLQTTDHRFLLKHKHLYSKHIYQFYFLTIFTSRTYLNDGPAFTAIIKQRFVDFIVREITLDEEVVRLTDISTVPQEKSAVSVFDKTKSTEACMAELVGTEEAKSFSAFSATPFEKDKPEANKFTFNWNGTKEERIKFHTLIKERFEHMDSNMSGGKLTVTKLPENKKREERWPKDRPPYLSFILYKESITICYYHFFHHLFYLAFLFFKIISSYCSFTTLFISIT